MKASPVLSVSTNRARLRAPLALGVVLGVILLVGGTLAGAAEAPVGLGTADSFAILAGSGVTNTGPTVINGDLGTCPTPAITGFPPGTVNGATHANDAVACKAKDDLVTAYNDAAGRAPNTTFPGATDLGGTTQVPGVYRTPTSFAITGTLTLNGQGDPNAVFIFQAGSTLITAVNSRVSLINGMQACNVFWQVGSSATLGVGSSFVGTIMALTSITANTDATVQGRLLARNGATTLDSNTVTRTACAAPATTTTTVAGATTTTTVAGATTTTVAGATTTTVAGATTTTGAPGASTSTTAAPGATTTTAAPGPAAGTTTTAGATTATTRPGSSPTTRPPGVAGPTLPNRIRLPQTGASTQSLLWIGIVTLELGVFLVVVAPIPARRGARRFVG